MCLLDIFFCIWKILLVDLFVKSSALQLHLDHSLEATQDFWALAAVDFSVDLNRCKSPAKNLASHLPGLFLFPWFWPGGVFSSSGWKNFNQEWSESLRLKICFWSSDWANNITPCLYFLQSQRWNVPQRLSQGKADWFSKAQQPNGSNASKCNLPNYPSASLNPSSAIPPRRFSRRWSAVVCPATAFSQSSSRGRVRYLRPLGKDDQMIKGHKKKDRLFHTFSEVETFFKCQLLPTNKPLASFGKGDKHMDHMDI